jgi:hypothetical protein
MCRISSIGDMTRNTLSIILLIGSLLTGGNAVAIEEPEYEVLAEVGDVEFRHYAPYLVAEVTVSGNAADRRAFQLLAGYIFGKNDTGEKMEMTAPVETRGNEYAFVMERKYSMDTLPVPDDERVQLRNKPARTVAVRRFSGRWSERNFDRHREALLDDLAALGVETTGEPELARYNSPFTPWFLRRNEIIVPVDPESINVDSNVAGGTSARL